MIKNNKKTYNYNYNEDDIDENNSKESNEDWNASKIPKSDFNKNKLIEITKRETNSKYFSKSQPDENHNVNENNLVSFTIGNYQNTKKNINSLNELKEFSSSDSYFGKDFSPKNYNIENNLNKIENVVNSNQIFYNGNASKFPKIPKKYSDIANIIKKDIDEAIKKEKTKEIDCDAVDSSRKYSSLSNINLNNNSTANTNDTNTNNNSNFIIIPDKKAPEEVKDKKPQHKLNLLDLLSVTKNKDE